MLFRTEPSGVLAISQPTHAWISGQILRAWDEALSEPLLLAGEQHDIGWLDWETAPTFNPLLLGYADGPLQPGHERTIQEELALGANG